MQRSFSSAATGRTHTRSVPTALDVAPEALPQPASRRHSRSRSRADTASSHYSPQRSVGAAVAAFAADYQFLDTPRAARGGATECTLDSSTAMSPTSDAARGEATASLDDRTLKLMQMQQALDNASLFRELEVENHMLFNFTYVKAGTSGSALEPGPASGASSGFDRRSDRSAAALRTPRGILKPSPAAGGSSGVSGGTGYLHYSGLGHSASSMRGGPSLEGRSSEAGAPSSLAASILPGPPQIAHHAMHSPRDADAVPAHADADLLQGGGQMWSVTPDGLMRMGGGAALDDRLPPAQRPWPAAGEHPMPPLPRRMRADSERSRRLGMLDRGQLMLGDDSFVCEIGSGIGAPLSAVSGKASMPPLSGAEMWVTAAESFGPGELSGPTSGSGTLRDGSMTLQLSR